MARAHGGARLVIVTSEHGHRYFAPREGLPNTLPPPRAGWDAFRAYGLSKLSNVLHAAEAGRRWRRAGGRAGGISAFAVHPGIVATSLGQLHVTSTNASACHDYSSVCHISYCQISLSLSASTF